MGLRAYNRQIREQLIDEAREQGRQEILDELRTKTPEEIRQILEQADQTDQPDGSDNDCG